MKIRYGCLVLLACVFSVGCTWIPDEGPRDWRIRHGAEAKNGSVFVQDLSVSIVNALNHYDVQFQPSLSMELPGGHDLGRIGSGDLLHISVWEPDQAGMTLLTHAGLDISNRVDSSGRISLPYAGYADVAGLTSAQAGALVEKLYHSKVATVQASVLKIEDVTDAVIVGGDVVHSGRIPLVPGQSNLLDVVALSGGVRQPADHMIVTLIRGNNRRSVLLSEIQRKPYLNVKITPGDKLLVEPSDHFFYAFGAVNRPGRQIFDGAQMTLLAALGHLSGLVDQRANPAGMYIFRRQPPELTKQLSGQTVIVNKTPYAVYRLNLRSPESFFVMNEFHMHDDDIIYVSNSRLAEAVKFAFIFSTISTMSSMSGRAY